MFLNLELRADEASNISISLSSCSSSGSRSRSGGSELSYALVRTFSRVHYFWDSVEFLFSEVLTADSWKRDGLVDLDLNVFGTGNLNSGLNRDDNRDIVSSHLGSNCVHNCYFRILGWVNDLGSSGVSLLVVGVCTDFIVNLVNDFSADSTCDWVALFSADDDLNGKFNRIAGSLKAGTEFCFVSDFHDEQVFFAGEVFELFTIFIECHCLLQILRNAHVRHLLFTFTEHFIRVRGRCAGRCAFTILIGGMFCLSLL